MGPCPPVPWHCWGLMPPRAAHPPCSPSSLSSCRKTPLSPHHSPPQQPCEQARPGWQILWSSPEPSQMLAGSTYHGCECISSRELFWAWHCGTHAPPAGTMGASCENQASPTGSQLDEPRALVWEGQHNEAILLCSVRNPVRLARRSRAGWDSKRSFYQDS